MGPAADPQDPLPEPKWLFRRLFTYLFVVVWTVLVGCISLRVPADDLQLIVLWLIGAVMLVTTYYLLAPSAEQLAQIFAAIRLRIGAPARAPSKPAPPPEEADA